MPSLSLRVGLLVALLAGLSGGLGGAALYSWLEGDGGLERGAIVRLGENIHLEDKPFCVTSQHFCIVELENGERVALYTYDPHAYMRTRGCEVNWLPEFRFSDRATGGSRLGWFVGACSGSVFALDGSLTFGPGPRDLDRLPLRIVELSEGARTIEVETGELICGAAHYGWDGDCYLAPLPQ